MKYIKHYNTIAQATADTTAFSPFVGYCNEVGSPIYLGGGINDPVRLINNGIYGLGVNLYIITGGTWDANISGNKIKVQIEGDVTLNGKVDCYSIEFGANGHLTINAGARLRIWEGGIVNVDCDTVNYLTIKEDAVNDSWGEFLLHPSVITNCHPKATVEYISKAYYNNSNDFQYQYFCPPMDGGVVDNIVSNNSTYMTQITVWRRTAWDVIGMLNGGSIDKSKFNIPFGFYSMTSNNPDNVTMSYTITGSLVGNVDQELPLYIGWTAISNGYMGIINKQKLWSIISNLDAIENNIYIMQGINVGMGSTEWIPYNPNTQGWDDIKLSPTIPFQLKNNGSATTITLSYKDLVWDTSFEDDTTPFVQTRGLMKGAPVELPNDPIFQDPPMDAFEDMPPIEDNQR